jgi:hypothetical protein
MVEQSGRSEILQPSFSGQQFAKGWRRKSLWKDCLKDLLEDTWADLIGLGFGLGLPFFPRESSRHGLAKSYERIAELVASQDPTGGEVGSKSLFFAKGQRRQGQYAGDLGDGGQASLLKEMPQGILLGLELFAGCLRQSDFSSIGMAADPVITLGLHAGTLDLDDHKPQVRVQHKKIYLPIPVRFGIEDPQAGENMGLWREGSQSRQNLLLTVQVRRKADGIRMKDGHG